MTIDFLILVVCFFFVAVIYSSVGFGGGSSYLALLAVMNLPFEVIRPTALLCNIIVVTSGTYIFWRSGALDIKKSLPFLLLSIPMAFLAATWRIGGDNFFFVVLGISLIVAAVLLWIKVPLSRIRRFDRPLMNAGLGGAIGFLSGFIGIGGGIFLSPILNLLNWAESRKIAGLASLFILLNSVSGLAGHLMKYPELKWGFVIPLLLAVFAGGQLGSRLGAKKLPQLYIKRVTAVVIFVAAIKILQDHL